LVLFDAWYPSKRLLQRLRDDRWSFVCQFKQNRPFEGMPLKHDRRQPYWQAVGVLSGGLKVRVVRDRRTSDATHRLGLTAQEVRTLYKRRHEGEEVITLLKSQLGLEAWQAGYKRVRPEKRQAHEGAQAHHIALCLAAYLILERERLDQGLTLR